MPPKKKREFPARRKIVQPESKAVTPAESPILDLQEITDLELGSEINTQNILSQNLSFGRPYLPT